MVKVVSAGAKASVGEASMGSRDRRLRGSQRFSKPTSIISQRMKGERSRDKGKVCRARVHEKEEEEEEEKEGRKEGRKEENVRDENRYSTKDDDYNDEDDEDDEDNDDDDDDDDVRVYLGPRDMNDGSN
ncbi:hypothetical protein HZH68_016415 [Vespula germanica]|uniref:Uncharacterized protein n=1 Tax=Vespula germanica TaxID=30212 RepID=A0A834MPQ4_VESGE|nr:hypothetical protein HZH68_016415 [Vespula germanica]